MLKRVWSLLHPDIVSMWVMTLVRTQVKLPTVEKYVGIMKTFSRDLGYTDNFHEVCSGGDVVDFYGDPFTGDIMDKTRKANRKYRTRIGEAPRRCISTYGLLPSSTTSTHIRVCTWCISTHSCAYPPSTHPPCLTIHPLSSIHGVTYPPIHTMSSTQSHNLCIYPLLLF